MFWKNMSAKDIESIVEKAVEKATSKNDETLKEERRRSNYLRASQSGQFKTREGIFEYFRAYENMTLSEALEATEMECKGRGIGENGKIAEPEKEPSMIKQIQDEAMNFVLSSLKSDPMGTLQTVGQVVGGVATFGAGLIGGKKIAEAKAENAETLPRESQQDLPTETISADEI